MTSGKVIFLALLPALAAQPAEARHSHHSHHAGHSHHSHYAHHAHRAAHHVAHHAATYAVHYETNRAVRAALAPIDGRAHPGHEQPPKTTTPEKATQTGAPASYSRTEVSHAGPRLGVTLATGETRVVTVEAGTPGYAAGIDPGDIVKKADGARIGSAADLAKAIDRAAATTGALHLVIEREGKDYDATVSLGAAKTP